MYWTPHEDEGDVLTDHYPYCTQPIAPHNIRKYRTLTPFWGALEALLVRATRTRRESRKAQPGNEVTDRNENNKPTDLWVEDIGRLAKQA